MPSTSEKQRRFMGAELARKRHGEKTDTGMSSKELEEFASKPVEPKRGSGSDSHHKTMRHKHPRGSGMK